MRSQPQYLAPNITESWLRKYQVLPGRTHPVMSTSGSGGYVLHAIKIYDNNIAKSTLVSERRLQRQKAAEAKRRKKAAAETAKFVNPSRNHTGNSQNGDGSGTPAQSLEPVGDGGDVEMEMGASTT